MTDQARGPDAALNSISVGERLRVAREAKGLSLAEIAARTRVPLRHLEAIEHSDFAGLPSSTYAVGFVRSYARAVGADEVALAHDTRIEVAGTVRTAPAYQPYEIADPKRVPSRTLVIVATGLGLAVLVLATLYFATTVFTGERSSTAPTPTVVAAVPAPRAAPTPVAGGQVRLTANDEVWIRVYDAADTTLRTGTLKAGESFDVPPGANDPMINVGRPDKLTVTLNGSAVAPLGTGERAIKDVRIGAAALAARAAGRPAPTPSPSDAAQASPSVPASTSPGSRAISAAPRRVSARDLIRPSQDEETRRANQRSPQPRATGVRTP